MHDGFDPTIVIFALLAGFVIWKLRSVLGTRVDIERRPPENSGAAPTQSANPGKVVHLPGAPAEARNGSAPADPSNLIKSDKARQGLASVSAADRGFDAARFVGGAKVAYEMIVTAFAAGDRQTLGNLLSPEVLSSFVPVIDQREAAQQKASTRLVSIESAEIVDAAFREPFAQVTVRFAAKMITVVRDAGGAVVSGDPDIVVSTDDIWTFARDVRSQDPTWRLIATESEPGA